MTPTHADGGAGPEDFASPDESRLFELLDSYLGSLHSGDVCSRSAVLALHPELLKWMRSLELLDRIAPPSDPPAGAFGPPGAPDRIDASAFAQSGGPDPGAGAPFGRYELLEEVGRGGMGVVFRARQTDLDRTVAVKMILSSRLASSDDVLRFYAEARAAGSVRHPNIVAIHEVGEVRGQHYFAMDFVEGRSLAALTAGGQPVEPLRAAQHLATIGRAVQFLHEHGIVHRDLKPSNILLDADGGLYVTDFGLAKALGAGAPQTQTGAIVGTVGYMSPEQAAGEAHEVSAISDVYSLGAILFELLTGRPPFRNSSPIDTLIQVIEGEPPRPTQLNPDIPVSLEWICLKCLEKEPKHRYESAAALVDDLERFLKEEPLSVGPPGIVRSLARWSRREPVLASHLGALAVATLIVQARYMVAGYDMGFHLLVMGTFAAWAVLSLLCHRLMQWTARPGRVSRVWAFCDVVCLTWMLEINENPLGPLLIGYPLLIAATGLFFRPRLVWFMTLLCLLGYGSLLVVGRESVVKPHYNVLYAASLLVIGFVVAYQAYRVRVLSNYLDDRG